MIRRTYIFLLLSILPGISLGQDLKLRVVDQENKPLFGYAVSPQNRYRQDVLTDENGIAVLDNSLRGLPVEVSGYNTKHKTVVLDGDFTTVVMDVTSEVVPLGYGNTVREGERTSAVSTVSCDDIERSVNNPANALYGKLAGLYVMQNETAAWNNDPTFFIRGLATLNNTTPLILVDGFERPLRSLSLEEIESVSVLKDAASLAIYGMRGANCIILVTTKRGLSQGMHAKVSYQFGVDTPFRLPEMADANQYAAAMNEALYYDGLRRRYSEADLNDIRTGANPEMFPNVNWWDEAVRSAGYNHELIASFRGGSKSVRYYSQLTYNGSDGLIKPADMDPDYSSQMEWDRLSVRTNLDVDFTPTTRLKVNVLGQIEQHHRPTTAYNTIFQQLYDTPALAFPIKTSTGKWGGDNLRNNPIGDLVGKGYTDGIDRALYADMRLTQNLSMLTEGLSVEGALAFDNRASFWEGQSKTYASEVLQGTRNPDGTMNIARTTIGADSPLTYSSSVGAVVMITTVDAIVRYNRDWGNRHTLKAMAGYHMEGSIKKDRNNTYRRQSVVASAHYGYMNRYFFDVAMSYAGSSVMPQGDKYRFFPAVSAAWVLSNENFLKNSKVVDYLKLRASWGITGSDLMSYGLSRQYYVGGNSYWFGSGNASAEGWTEGALANYDLTCETAYKANVGIDMQLFKGLDLSMDAFYEDRQNILCSTENVYSSILGVAMSNRNEGHVRNRGVEAALNWHQTIGDWSYMIGGTFTFARNEIVNMNEGYQPYDYLCQTGGRIGQFFGLQAVGFFRDMQDVENSVEHTFSQVRPGDVKYKDLNDDKKIDAYDRIAMGYSTTLPEIYYGFTVGAQWRGIGIRADFQGVANYTLLKSMTSYYQPLRNNKNVSTHYLANRWTAANMENALYPRLSTLDNQNNYQNSSIWQENGAFLKLRNLEISWTLPKRWSNAIRTSSVRIFARGSNLFSLDNVKSLDPEMLKATYPSLRSYHIGVNLTF